MKRLDKHKKQIARLLILAFFLVCLPLAGVPAMDSFAAPGDTTEAAGDSSGSRSSGGQVSPKAGQVVETPYTVHADSAPSYEAYKGMSAWKDRKTYEAPSNTYVLTVATGASAGDTVLYFGIRYKTPQGQARSQYVFPGIDAGSRSAALLAKYAKGENIKETFGMKALSEIHYQEKEIQEETLAAWSVQDYAFQTEDEIGTVESVDVYLAKGQWSVQGLSIFRMDNFKGYEEYGLVSGQKFLDFEGRLIADLVKKDKANTPLVAKVNDSVIRLGGDDNSRFDIQNYGADSVKRNYAGEYDLYSFRVDFSDVVNAGLEGFMNTSAKSLKDDIGIIETMTMEIQYRDTHNWTRKVILPVVLSSYIMARYATGSSTILGFGQRGDKIAFQAVLPEYGSLVSDITISTGTEARKKLQANGIEIKDETAAMKKTAKALAADELQIAGVSFYKGGCMPYVGGGTDTRGRHLEGATLDFVFEGGSTPLLYYIAGDERGQMVSPNGNAKISLRNYKAGSPLTNMSNGQGRFLVSLYTTGKTGAGMDGDVSLRFNYLNMEGKMERTLYYKAKQSAESFMGIWPSLDGGSYIAKTGFVEGGKVSYLMDAPNAREFTNVELSLTNGGSWEMKNITVAYVESYKARRAYIAPSEVTESRFWIEREITASEVFNLSQINPEILDKDGNVIGSDGQDTDGQKELIDESGKPATYEDGQTIYVDPDEQDDIRNQYQYTGSQLFFGDTSYKIDFRRGVVADIRDADWSTVRYSMSYEQTQINWGFFTVEKTYDVSVIVADDSEVETGNGDAGSVNYFYFQLLFENGNSGFVQANQQLAGDAFRSGQTETFTISVNRNYGDVLAIRILPEDLSSDSTPFDKLNIEKIIISERNNGGTYLSYVVDQVGWIEIDYRDEAEKSSARGMKARTVKEISKTYDVSYKQRAVMLLCEISTLPWDGDSNQFVGSIIATVDYINSDGQAKKLSFDAVQYMASYMRKTAKSMERVTDPKDQSAPVVSNGAITDPATMLRPGKTDRFIMPAIPDLKSLKAITFTCQTRNSEAAYWNIGKVAVSQIVKDGPLELTASGELYRNMETKNLCINEEDKVFSKYFRVGIPADMETISFTENQLVWTSEQWATPVSRIPASQDDTVNIYVYPTVSNAGSIQSSYFTNETPASPGQAPETRTVHANLKYNIAFSRMRAVSCDLTLTYDAAGNPMYYATGVIAKDMISAGNLLIQAPGSNMAFNRAIVQHVKSKVVMSTATYNFMNSRSAMGVSADPYNGNFALDETEQTVMLSFGKDTPTQTLQAEQHDVAVAFLYTSSIDDGTIEYQSPYVYLTDAGYKSVSEGLMAKLSYKVPYVRQITGYRIAAYGNLQGTIDASAIYVEKLDTTQVETDSGYEKRVEKSLRDYASVKNGYPLPATPESKKVTSHAMWGEGSVTPISLSFTTTEALKTMDGIKDAAARMVFTYMDYQGISHTVRYDDMTQYIQDGTKAFPAEKEPKTVEFFLTEMNKNMGINSLEIVPYDRDVQIYLPGAAEPINGADPQVDTLIEQMSEGSGIFTDGAVDPELREALIAARSANWTISRVEYDAGFRTNIVTKEGEQNFMGLSNGGSLRLNSVALTTSVTKNGLSEGMIQNRSKQMVAKGGDVITGTVTVRDSLSGFRVHAYRMIGDAGDEVTADTIITNDVTRSFSFTVPSNTSGALVIYKIEISPVEAEDIVDVIFVSVESVEVGLETTYALNGGADTPVVNHAGILVAKSDDVLTIKTKVTNSGEGITVWAFRMVGDAGKPVTDSTVSDLTAGGFNFTVPENTSGGIEQYRIDISPTDNTDVKDSIYISVEPKVIPQEPDAGTPEESGPEGTMENPAADASSGGGEASPGGETTEP